VRASALGIVAAVALLTTSTAPAPAYEVTGVDGAGALAGVVRFAGTPPALSPPPASRSRDACADHGDADALVVGPDHGVRDGVVLVEGVARGKKPAAEAVLDTARCAFVGHVIAVMAGERARLRNGDTVLHSPQGFQGTPAVFSLALPGRDQSIDISRRLGRPGVVRVVCDVHPHMGAWIVIHDSPYYAVTDEHGAYRIAGIPPGRYRVTMWHEGFRARGRDADGRVRYEAPQTVTRAVTIAPGATATMDFELR